MNKEKAKRASDNRTERKRERKLLLQVKDLEIESEEKRECVRAEGGTHSCVKKKKLFNSFSPGTNITVSFPQKTKDV